MLWTIWLILIVVTPALAGAIIYWQIQSEQTPSLIDQSIDLVTAPIAAPVQTASSE
jgi:hypothetical protein